MAVWKMVLASESRGWEDLLGGGEISEIAVHLI